MARNLSAYLQDVLEACKSIEDVMNGISLDEYRNKRAVKSAVERSISFAQITDIRAAEFFFEPFQLHL